MQLKDFMSPEWPRWVNGLGFYVMSVFGDDDSEWSEDRGYFVNYNPGTQLWTLTVTTRSVHKEKDSVEFEEYSEENIGPHDLGKLREILAHYEIEISDDDVNEIIKRMTNPYLL